MAKTSWVIMKHPYGSGSINIDSVHMIGFRPMEEAAQECARLNERSRMAIYFIQRTKVFCPPAQEGSL